MCVPLLLGDFLGPSRPIKALLAADGPFDAFVAEKFEFEELFAIVYCHSVRMCSVKSLKVRLRAVFAMLIALGGGKKFIREHVW